MKWNELPCNSQLRSEHQIVSTLGLGGKCTITREIHKKEGRLHGARIPFSIEAHKQITIASGNKGAKLNLLLSATTGSFTRAHSEKNFIFLKKLGSQDSCLLFLEFSYNFRISEL